MSYCNSSRFYGNNPKCCIRFSVAFRCDLAERYSWSARYVLTPVKVTLYTTGQFFCNWIKELHADFFLFARLYVNSFLVVGQNGAMLAKPVSINNNNNNIKKSPVNLYIMCVQLHAWKATKKQDFFLRCKLIFWV